MTQPSTWQLVAAAAYLLPSLVFAIVAGDLWEFNLRVRPRNQLSRLMPWLASTATCFFFLQIVFAMLPIDIHRQPPPPLVLLYIFADAVILTTVALTCHVSRLVPLAAAPPSRRWLLINYGLAAVFIILSIDPQLIPAATWDEQLKIMNISHFTYIVAALAVSVWQVARHARRGLWRPGSLGDMRTADVIILTFGVLGSAVLFVAIVRTRSEGWDEQSWLPFLSASVGLSLATPFAVRILGRVVRTVTLTFINLAVVGALYWTAQNAAAAVAPELRPIFQLAALFLPILLLMPAQAPLRELIDRLLFRRRFIRQAELQAALVQLSPELGIVECCRRAMEAFVRIMQLRGAGVLLDEDGTVVVAGEIDMEPLRRVWPRGAAAAGLPTVVFAGGVFRELPAPLQQALIDAEVVGVTPIVSPRRRWGFGFVTTGVLHASFTIEEIDAVQALAAQFALVLDAAELLERAVAVERSLAHSEKLAAVGELAARVAHEIRNPVTAARSLAQLMVREPTSPHNAEHAELILAELGRVENQVRALLRFARREEFSFELVDLGEVARSALDALRPRLEASGVAIETDIAVGVMARADREKIRQVLVNLVDNAADAVGTAAVRRLAVAVHGINGTAIIEVEDSGPGVAADALPRLFEPFFSLKTNGTGLGLAIVKRTVEAHGGRVEARTGRAAGMLMRVELPAAAAA
jgi:signal transduction histidine kinase